MPGQSQGFTIPTVELFSPSLAWFSFTPASLDLGTACTGIDTGQRPSPVGSVDVAMLY